jgi:S-adenosylmethionine uptake transporter
MGVTHSLRPHPEQNVVRGMLIMAVAVLMLPGLDAFAKLAAASVPSGQVAWFRFIFQALVLLPLVLWKHRGWPRVSRIPVHALRGTLIALATLLFFTALVHLPMAEAIAIFFVEPLILTLFSTLFLRESVGWRRIVAILVGFGGALLVIRPSYAAFGPAALLPLGTAVCFAGYLAMSRSLARDGDALTMQFTTGIAGGIVMSVALAIGWGTGMPYLAPVLPTQEALLLLIAMGCVATAGHMLLVQAFQYAPAGLLAPFQYLEIVSATILGYLVFGDLPDLMTFVGVAIIVTSGLYVFHRERQIALRPPPELPAP